MGHELRIFVVCDDDTADTFRPGVCVECVLWRTRQHKDLVEMITSPFHNRHIEEADTCRTCFQRNAINVVGPRPGRRNSSDEASEVQTVRRQSFADEVDYQMTGSDLVTLLIRGVRACVAFKWPT